MTALFRADTLRRAEAAAISASAPLALMRRAAQALSDLCVAEARRCGRGQPIIALVGPGNNGADALLASMSLRERGFDARAVLLESDEPRAADARAALAEARAAGFPLPTELSSSDIGSAAFFVDGLFGIGLSRPICGRAAEWISTLNAAAAPVVAVDIPSGINADTGAVLGGTGAPAVRAALTLTFLGDKPGLHTGSGLVHSGRVFVDTLAYAPGKRDGTLIGLQQAIRLAAPLARRRDSHKGSHGHVAIFGGSPGMRGAAVLAALAAQRAGAGKVSVGSPDGWQLAAESYPALMSLRRPQPLLRFGAVVAGCGLGSVGRVDEFLEPVFDQWEGPLVLDADALNRVAQRPDWTRSLLARRTPAVLTPHPLEAARLLATETGAVQEDRIAAARALAAQTGAVVVLKGAGTVCADASGHWAIVDAGSPSLATGGTGDALAGVIGALLAQGLDPASAACLGAWAHARAGERWASQERGELGMSAGELADVIRQVLNGLVSVKQVPASPVFDRVPG